MSPATQQIVEHYTDAYQKLYNREPRDIRMVDSEWIIVNGARMRVNELESLTHQLRAEYQQGREEKRSVVQRLVKWFKGV
jgi:predicted patatin/cPLA2 family phospholipase